MNRKLKGAIFVLHSANSPLLKPHPTPNFKPLCHSHQKPISNQQSLSQFCHKVSSFSAMEHENKNGSGAATAAGSGTATAAGSGVGRLLVDETCSNRHRFEVELKEGETTIVSWTKLLQDSGIPVVVDNHSSPPPNPKHRQVPQEDETRSECSDTILKKEKDEQKSPTRPNTQKSAISEVLEAMNIVQATKNTKIGHARVKALPLTHHVIEEHSLNNTRYELPDLNVPYTVQSSSTLPTNIKDESCVMVEGSMLESILLEIETMVVDSRRLHSDVLDADHTVATKSKLPRELKQKLKTVARLAHSTQGSISDELNTRLVSILGHWLKPKTLKRCLRDMVPSDLSAWEGDALRFSQIEKEVVELIKLRSISMETKDGFSTETVELCAAHKTKYSMDHEMEDKVCDFYDIYVQGMNDINSSEIRKFYLQLAALWPKGTMDNHGVRNAICRSKERRRIELQEKELENGKRMKTSTTGMDEDLQVEAKLVAESEKLVNDTDTPVLNFRDSVVPGTPELDQNLSAPAKRFSPSSAGSCQDLFKQRKFNILNETS